MDAAAAYAEVAERSTAADVPGDDQSAESACARATQAEGQFHLGTGVRPKVYLDGETFGMPADGRVDARLPSGNGRAGGDFDMWFWLLRQGVRIPGIGFFPGRASRFFAVSGTTSPGKEALQLGIERSSPDLRGLLPTGAEVDAGQRFNAAEAAGLARRTGVSGVAGLASEKYSRLATFLSERLQGVLRMPMRFDVYRMCSWWSACVRVWAPARRRDRRRGAWAVVAAARLQH